MFISHDRNHRINIILRFYRHDTSVICQMFWGKILLYEGTAASEVDSAENPSEAANRKASQT
jgi:hypothetical protein